MATYLTGPLRAQLEAVGGDPDGFAHAFDEWKASFPGSEFSRYLFGKDGAYHSPPVAGKPYLLRHVHLAPLADKDALRQWETDFRRQRRKQSDRALIYTSDRTRHLLIYILDDPGAHAIAQMRTPEHAKLMRQFAAVAAEFIATGKIIA